jgi:hypothetical protein
LNTVLMPQLAPNHAPRRASLLSNPSDWQTADGEVVIV